MKRCNHASRKDLTQSLGVVRHFYCPICKSHWYKGKYWTAEEWFLYVNGEILNGEIEKEED